MEEETLFRQFSFSEGDGEVLLHCKHNLAGSRSEMDRWKFLHSFLTCTCFLSDIEGLFEGANSTESAFYPQRHALETTSVKPLVNVTLGPGNQSNKARGEIFTNSDHFLPVLMPIGVMVIKILI